MKRTLKTNDTKIKYLLVVDCKLYEVVNIDLIGLTIEAIETELTIPDVPPEEVFDITEFREFKITLRNRQGKVIIFQDYVKNRKVKS